MSVRERESVDQTPLVWPGADSPRIQRVFRFPCWEYIHCKNRTLIPDGTPQTLICEYWTATSRFQEEGGLLQVEALSGGPLGRVELALSLSLSLSPSLLRTHTHTHILSLSLTLSLSLSLSLYLFYTHRHTHSFTHTHTVALGRRGGGCYRWKPSPADRSEV